MADPEGFTPGPPPAQSGFVPGPPPAQVVPPPTFADPNAPVRMDDPSKFVPGVRMTDPSKFVPGGGPPSFTKTQPGLADAIRVTKYEDTIQQASKKYGVDPNWIRAIHSIEDYSDDPAAMGPLTGLKAPDEHAVGEMQMLPTTFAAYKTSPGAKITDPNANIEAGVRYFSHLLQTFGGDVDRAVEAYNEGEGAEKSGSHAGAAYAKNVEQQYAYALRDGFGASAPTQKRALTQGTAPKAAPAKGVGLPPGFIPGEKDLGLANLNNNLNEAQHISEYLTTSAFKALPASSQAHITAMLQSAPVTSAEDGVNLLMQGVDAFTWDQFGSMLKDNAEGKGFQNWGSMNTALIKAMANPKTAGQVLSAMQQKYGLNTREQMRYWITRPGVMEQISHANVTDPGGFAWKFMAGLAADNSRAIINYPAVAGLETFIGEWFNPAWKLKPVEAGAALVRSASKTTLETMKTGSKAEAAFAKHIESTSDKMHAFASRYYRMAQKFGPQGEKSQRRYVDSQYQSTKMVRDVASQITHLGKTTREQRLQIQQEADTFANPRWTLHQRNDGPDVRHDPTTNTTSMQLGPVEQGNWNDHVFARHVQTPTTVEKGKEAETIFASEAAQKQWTATVGRASNVLTRKTGDIAHAMAETGMPWEDAMKFESDVLSDANKAPPQMHDEIIRTAIQKRALGEWMRNTGKQGIEWSTKGRVDEVLLPIKPNALTKDHTDINGFSVNERAENTLGFMRQQDKFLKTIAPEESKYFLAGYWPRSGMFKEDPAEGAVQQGGHSLENRGGGGGNPAGVNKKGRDFTSIQEAKDAGKEINPKFDPADSIERAYGKQNQFTNYVMFAHAHSQPIDYKSAIAAAFEDDPPLMEYEHENSGGPDGLTAFNKWSVAEAKKRLMAGTSGRYSKADIHAASDKQIGEFVKNVAGDIQRRVQDTWEREHMDPKTGKAAYTWRGDKATGVSSLGGVAIPVEVRDAMIDGHPNFQPGVKDDPTKLWTTEEKAIDPVGRAIEGTSRGLRSGLFLDPLYHPWRNIARIAFIHGKMSPIQIVQALLAPHTIEASLLHEAEQAGALSTQFHLGGSDRQVNVRNAYAEGPRPTAAAGPGAKSRAILNSKMDLPTRVKSMVEGMKNVRDSDGSATTNAQHWLSKAWYNLDQSNQEWVFGVSEDVMSAMNYQNLKRGFLRKGMSDGDARAAAGNEVRRQFGDAHNISHGERAAGAQKLVWFYAWMRGQWKLWSRVFSETNVAKGAVVPTAAAESYNAAKPDEDPGMMGDSVTVQDGDRQYAVSLGGPERKAMALLGLASTPVQGAAAADDFMRYFTEDMAFEAVPLMKLIIRAFLTATEPGAEPSETGTLFDKDVPMENRAMQMAQQTAGGMMPTVEGAATDAVGSRGLTLLNLLGYNVRRTDTAGERTALSHDINRWRAKEHTLDFYQKKDPAARSALQDSLGRPIYDLEQLKQQAK